MEYHSIFDDVIAQDPTILSSSSAAAIIAIVLALSVVALIVLGRELERIHGRRTNRMAHLEPSVVPDLQEGRVAA